MPPPPGMCCTAWRVQNPSPMLLYLLPDCESNGVLVQQAHHNIGFSRFDHRVSLSYVG